MTKTIDDINLMEWFSDRKLNFVPAHFYESSIALTNISVIWVEEKLIGRYATKKAFGSLYGLPCFEDQKELMLYELTFG